MTYRTILLMAAIFPCAWGQTRPHNFNCTNDAASVCQIQTATLPATSSLTVSVVNGSVSVETWDTPEIQIRAEVRAPAATTDAGDIVIEETSPGEVSVLAKRGLALELKIDLPAATALTISTVNGELFIRGVEANVIAQAVNGDIFVAVGGEHWAGQSLVVDTVNGNIGVIVPADCSAQVAASVREGTITTNFPAETVSGVQKVSFSLGSPSSSTIAVAPVSGNIWLRSED